MKQQQQTRFPNSKAQPRPKRQVEAISAMIQRVAQEHRLRSASTPEAAQMLPTAPPVAGEPPSHSQSSPAVPLATIGAGGGSDVQRVRCARGHPFAMLDEHPVIDGTDACPHCMSNTIHEYRKTFAAMVRPTKFE